MLLFGCITSDPINYEGIEVPVKRVLRGELLDTGFLFSFPKEMIVVDNYLVIHDAYNQDSCFHIFNKENGKHLRSFGAKGRGPGEVLFPGILSFNYTDGYFQVYEPNMKKIVRYYLDEEFPGKAVRFTENKLKKILSSVLDVYEYNDKYLLRSDTEKRFEVMDKDSGIIYTCLCYPDIHRDSELNRAVFNYSPCRVIRPEGDKMAMMTYIGGITEIFSLEQRRITPLNVNYLYKPIFREFEGTKPKWVASVKETVFGCNNAYATNDYIWTVYIGQTVVEGEIQPYKIIVFNWEGRPVFQYDIIEGIPQSIAVDDNYIYCIITNKDYEYQLYKYAYEN